MPASGHGPLSTGCPHHQNRRFPGCRATNTCRPSHSPILMRPSHDPVDSLVLTRPGPAVPTQRVERLPLGEVRPSGSKVDRFISASVSEDCSGGQRSATKLVTSCLAPLGPPPMEGQSPPPTLSKAGQRDRHRTERPEASKLPREHLAASPTSKVTFAGNATSPRARDPSRHVCLAWRGVAEPRSNKDFGRPVG